MAENRTSVPVQRSSAREVGPSCLMGAERASALFCETSRKGESMRRKAILALLLSTMLMLFLVSCGSSGSNESASSGSSAAASGGSGAAVPTDKVMKIGSTQACTSLDPANGYDHWYTVRYGVGETLMKFNDDMTPSPWLAAEMPTVSDDQLTWTVNVRDDVTFSTGEKLTGEKVKAALERQCNENDLAKNYFKLKEITADGQTVAITTESPVPIMPYLLADPVFVIYDTADLTDVAEKGPIATGPFVFKSFDSVAQNVSVASNDNYWNGTPSVSGLDFVLIPDPVTLGMSLKNGEIDAGYGVGIEDMEYFEGDSNYTVSATASGRTTFGFMNQSEGKALKDETLRQAIIRMLDREAYCDVQFYGQYVPGKTPLASSLPYGYDELKDINAYDLNGAIKLLDEAGYVDADGDGWRDMPDGSPLEISITSYEGRVEIPVLAQIMQQEGKEIGLHFEINNTDSSTAWNLLTTGEYDVLIMSVNMAASGDPETAMKSYFRSYSEETPNYNLSGYSDPEVDALFDKLSVEFDIDKRIELVKQIEQMMMDDSCCIYFCYPLINYVTKSDVVGLVSHTSDYYWANVETGFAK